MMNLEERMINKDNQTRFKTLMLSSILCDYGIVYTYLLKAL